VEKSEIAKKIQEEEDFIHCPKHQNSLTKFLAKTDNLVEDTTIGKLLLLSEEEVNNIYQKSVIELREAMDFNDEDSKE
jgi:hypothetical protein